VSLIRPRLRFGGIVDKPSAAGNATSHSIPLRRDSFAGSKDLLGGSGFLRDFSPLVIIFRGIFYCFAMAST
jgi:hypothetical protein